MTLLRRHGQLNEKWLTDAFPLKNTESIEVAKSQGCVKERNRQWFASSCTNV